METVIESSTLPAKKCRKSDVWKYFDKVERPDETGKIVPKAACKVCDNSLVYGGTHGTSHLARHAVRCCERTTEGGQQTVLAIGPNGLICTFTFSQKTARQETVRYFVREELPFNKVDKPAFRRYISKSFGPQFKPPCRVTMRNDVMLLFKEEKTLLQNVLKQVPGRICFISDLWTSNQKLGYMCITAHYINSEWELNKRVISFPMLPSPHTGKAISEEIYSNLLGWNISDKVGTLTLDNASNNDSTISRLKDSLFGLDLLWRDLFHVRCNAHIINLLVKDGLDHVVSSLDNIRESVRHVKNSQAKLQSFFECCQRLGMKEKRLPIDIQTRWDSTFLMLEAAIPYQKHVPTPTDWNNVVVLQDFLKVFKDSTKMFSGSGYVTSSLFCLQMSKISGVLLKYGNQTGFKVMCDSMKLKYNKYWQNIPLVLALASCMDPRYKLTILELCLDLNHGSESGLEVVSNESELKIGAYKIKLSELYEEYEKKVNSNATGHLEATSSLSVDDDIVAVMLSRRRESSIKTCKSDLQRYLDQPPVQVQSLPKFNVLEWWKAQESTYLVLSAMARDLLTIPVSTVASESAFSGSERVVSKCRSCLKPDIVEALMCLKDWFQAEEGLQDEDPDDIEELMREEP
ncbi:hypothetical protein AQUCO_12400007v1 [Aquilegia coerulea]|uniref:BED-type domain-containing protein n=1 Tax=Aquilegia coerulea TaxID=218851 RepID=A0A2G5C1J1_AQUCA|nr:hypothetical protein AQUCO_12400007v1 [Aquilegia coerulea]